MVSAIYVSIEVSHDNLFLVLVNSVHYYLGYAFKTLVYFVLRLSVYRHVNYMELCVPYFNSYAPSLFQKVLWMVNDVMFDIIFNVETNSPTPP